mmetsp:Transcript_31663/g.73951  ORF Transcript_31663/g.73951 Transcript_31663/m.73951 type:complete len:760 (+) Transcript_31663:45-2324(+)
MKQVRTATVLLALLGAASVWPSAGIKSTFLRKDGTITAAERKSGRDRTITEVVKMLQSMLDQSKADAEADREAYAKFKCYCDDTEQAKRDSIEALTQQIEILQNGIEGMKGTNGRLSQEAAQLQADLEANAQSQTDAQAVRDKENTAFQAEESDLTQAIDQMKQAIEILDAIGADQTLQSSADHKKFMANYGNSLMRLRSSMKQALLAAKTFLRPGQQHLVDAFLQQRVPFTGTYTAQSANIVGILKQMRDTFEANLESARSAETAQAEAHTKFMANAAQAAIELNAALTAKQTEMGNNDGDLTSKKNQLGAAELAKADDEAFLASLLPMCSDKAKEYQERQAFRTNEDAALSQAIAILNSDQAFSTFGTVDATSTGATSFLQLSEGTDSPMSRVADALAQQAKKDGSKRLLRLSLLVKSGNPFTIVIAEINKMMDLLVKEGEADQNQLEWCDKERGETQAAITEKEGIETSLNDRIEAIDTSINNPTDGMLFQIGELENDLVTNRESQATETSMRKTENLAYQKDANNIADAAALLKEAVRILTNFYNENQAGSGGAELVQEEPAPPDTWDTAPGQGQQGQNVIQMLEYILGETEKEGNAAHADEEEAQHSYEDSMTQLKKSEAEDMSLLAGLREDLAEAKQEMEAKHEELHATERELMTLRRYLESINPGCDWIVANIDTRNSHRAEEEAALKNAIDLLEETPAFKAAAAQEVKESYGSCWAKCNDNEAHVECKACMAGVSKPGYCAGHPDTPGCSS